MIYNRAPRLFGISFDLKGHVSFHIILNTFLSSLPSDHLRTGCDLMNLFFVVDEYTDVESEPVVREMVDIVIDALNNPHKARPEGEILLGEVAKQ